MKYSVSILLMCFLGTSFTAFARPELSQAMIEIFERQYSRLQGGREGIEKLLSDLDGQPKRETP